MNNTFIKNSLFTIFFFVSTFALQAQVSESCDCSVDTIGYSSFVQTLNPDENAPFQFHVNGTFAVAYGLIGSTTPNVVQSLIDNHPLVTTIIMLACPGSQDDVANLQAATLIYNHGYKMYLPNNGWVASGATDMYLAGSTRIAEVTTNSFGVHSWSDGTNEASDFPVGHAVHQPYINYYVNVGFTLQQAKDFYYFTINAASANNIYWMTEIEINQYKVRSCKYASSPTYSVTQNGNSLTADLTGATYQWINCIHNTIISGSTSQTFTAINNGNYAVIITETGCADTSACYSVTGVGIIENNFNKELLFYPNPTDGYFSIDLRDRYQSITITMTDLTGKFTKLYKYNDSQLLHFKIDEPSGVYLLIIESGNQKAVIRLIKK
jgi:hypothetical protein